MVLVDLPGAPVDAIEHHVEGTQADDEVVGVVDVRAGTVAHGCCLHGSDGVLQRLEVAVGLGLEAFA